MAVQLPNGRNYFATATGAPGVGCRLYTYIPGTSTPKATYTTSAASVANTNPVVADARGEMVIYWDGSYDVVLRDANDNLIWGPERLEDAAGNLEDALADTSSASNNGGLVGHDDALTYAAGTSGAAIKLRALVTGQEFTGNIFHKGPAYLTNGRAPYNTVFGSDALTLNQYVPNQFPAGGGIFYAGGDYNTAVGTEALKVNTEGRRNTAVGSIALQANTTGYYNTAVGSWSMVSNTSGYENTALGVQTLQFNTSGFYNVALGASALNHNTTGQYNVAAGHSALLQNTTGEKNIAIGRRANWVNTTGNSNIAIGNDAFSLNQTGNYNVVIGDAAGGSSVSAANCVFVGRRAGSANTTDDITGIGTDALVSNTTGGSNTAVGKGALGSNTTGSLNTAVGNLALASATTTSGNTAMGRSAATATTGASNTALGDQALADNITGNQNTAVGAASLPTQTNLSNTTGLGYQATCVASNQITLGNSSISSLRCQVTTITALSDARDKADIAELEPLIPDAFLDRVLTPYVYNWAMRDGTQRDDGLQVGVIAQFLRDAQNQFNLAWLGLVDETNPDRLEATPGKLLPLVCLRAQRQEKRLRAIEAHLGLS